MKIYSNWKIINKKEKKFTKIGVHNFIILYIITPIGVKMAKLALIFIIKTFAKLGQDYTTIGEKIFDIKLLYIASPIWVLITKRISISFFAIIGTILL